MQETITLMEHNCDNAAWERRGSKMTLAMVAATAAVAGTRLLTASAGGASFFLLREGGPPLSLATVAGVGGAAARCNGRGCCGPTGSSHFSGGTPRAEVERKEIR